jgi:hypothetical protein
MAEATYYLKAYCDSDEQAEAVAEDLKALFSELDQVYAFRLQDINPASEDFAKQYPLVAEFLKAVDIRTMHRLPDVGFTEGNLDTGGSILYYYSIVGHLNDWSPITDFMQKKWGCKASWISDEYINPFDLL